ncbi:MAG: hypothetical protein FD136_1327 [Chitinophagaceae bacterium]|nr:MAG: hypothetical protein FD183_198 [Chitinophagaceae bacterium]TXT32406.1 MAG: hypothetical protein FD136_1327 [Chitinophagaceae bacterium]
MSKNLVESVDFYFDKDGFMVLTEKYHLDKGYCCGHGCRHCPFEYESVPEPKKSEMLLQKQTTR